MTATLRRGRARPWPTWRARSAPGLDAAPAPRRPGRARPRQAAWRRRDAREAAAGADLGRPSERAAAQADDEQAPGPSTPPATRSPPWVRPPPNGDDLAADWAAWSPGPTRPGPTEARRRARATVEQADHQRAGGSRPDRGAVRRAGSTVAGGPPGRGRRRPEQARGRGEALPRGAAPRPPAGGASGPAGRAPAGGRAAGPTPAPPTGSRSGCSTRPCSSSSGATASCSGAVAAAPTPDRRRDRAASWWSTTPTPTGALGPHALGRRDVPRLAGPGARPRRAGRRPRRRRAPGSSRCSSTRGSARSTPTRSTSWPPPSRSWARGPHGRRRQPRARAGRAPARAVRGAQGPHHQHGHAGRRVTPSANLRGSHHRSVVRSTQVRGRREAGGRAVGAGVRVADRGGRVRARTRPCWISSSPPRTGNRCPRAARRSAPSSSSTASSASRPASWSRWTPARPAGAAASPTARGRALRRPGHRRGGPGSPRVLPPDRAAQDIPPATAPSPTTGSPPTTRGSWPRPFTTGWPTSRPRRLAAAPGPTTCSSPTAR